MEGVEEKRSFLVKTRTSDNGKDEPRSALSTATPAVLLSTFVAICGSLAGGWVCGFTSPAEAGIIEDLGLSVAEYSFFTSVMTIGAMIGSMINGRVTDIIGRRAAMGLSQLFYTTGSLGIALAQNAWWLDLGRLLTGIGAAFSFYAVPIYLAEIAPKNLRGGLMMANEVTMGIGLMLVFILGILLPWRILALLGAIPCLALIVGSFFIPESPRWLAKLGREEQLEAVLLCLRGKKFDISETEDIKDFTESSQSEARTLDLFQRRYLYILTVAVGLVLFQQFSGQTAVVAYANSIFESADFPSSAGPIALGIIQIAMTTVNVLVVDKFGRKLLLMASATGMCCSYLLVASSFLLQSLHKYKELTPFMALIGILASSVTSALGMLGLPRVIIAEVLPINIKGSAGSLVTFIYYASACIITLTFNFLMEWNSAATFLLFSGVSGLAVLFIAKRVPETKGRTLEGLQASLR